MSSAHSWAGGNRGRGAGTPAGGERAEDPELEPYDGAGSVRISMLPIVGLASGQGRSQATAEVGGGGVRAAFLRRACGPLRGAAAWTARPKEKEVTMAAFRRGELQVLVATTVIEVGVDVTNADVIVIETRDRFGIAQLPSAQRQGRPRTDKSCATVGRGRHRWRIQAPPCSGGLERRIRARRGDLDLRG